jgi:hypothetical protein
MTEIQALAQNLMITRIIMFTTILMAITSIVFSSIAMAFERSHNVKSLRPFINVLQRSTQNAISLTIDNAGLGPMLMERLTFFLNDEPETEGELLAKILPTDLKVLNNFVCSEVYALAAHDQLNIFEYVAEKQDAESLSELKALLSGYSIRIEYRDVYDHEYKKESKITFCNA